MWHGDHALPLSFTICRLRQLESVTPEPPVPPGHFILQCPIARTPKRFHMSTLTWLLIFASRTQPALFPGLGQPPRGPGAHTILGPPVMWPQLQQKHYIQALWKHQPPFSLEPRQCPRTAWFIWGLRDAENVIILGELRVRSHCLFWPLSADAAASIRQGLLPALTPPRAPSSKRGFRFQRNEVSALRGSRVFNCWSGGLSRAEGSSCVIPPSCPLTPNPTDGWHLLFQPGI